MKINGKTIQPVKAVITPHAMARMSEELFLASENFTSDRFPLINHFLYAASIEIGLKASILACDCTKKNKGEVKKLNHDLNEIVRIFENKVIQNFYSKKDQESIGKLNTHYKNKGLEYFTLPTMASSLKGFKDFPEIEDIRNIAKRTNALIVLNKYYVQAQTSDGTGGGLVNFY